jgi:hypothetical protein
LQTLDHVVAIEGDIMVTIVLAMRDLRSLIIQTLRRMNHTDKTERQ